MKKQGFFLDALIYALYMFISSLVTLCAEMLITKVVNNLFVMTPFGLCVIRAVVYSVGVIAILGIMAFREGYKTVECSIPASLISGGIAVIIHFFFSLLFSFDAFCSGAVKFVSALIKFGADLGYNDFKSGLDRFDCIAVFFVYGAFYVIFMLVMKRVGQKKRLADRHELLRDNTDNNN